MLVAMLTLSAAIASAAQASADRVRLLEAAQPELRAQVADLPDG